MAAMAMDQRPCLQFTAGIINGFRAAEILGPAQLEQGFPASGLAVIFFEEFQQTQTFLELDRIPGHGVTSCSCSVYEISKCPSH